MAIARLLPPVLLGCCYFIAAGFAVLLTRYEGGVAWLWIATSVLTAALISKPRRSWRPSIVACAIASAVVTSIWGLGWTVAIPFTFVNMIEAVTAAYLLRRFADARRPLGSLGWILHFIASVGIAAPLVAASLGAAAASWSGYDFGSVFVTVASGHALGNLTFTPMFLLLTAAHRKAMLHELRRRDVAETVALLMLAIVTSTIVFSQERFPLLFLPTLPIILIAFRLGRGGVAISIAILAVIGGLATATGEGPIHLVDGSFAERMRFFQFYLAATVLTLLPVTADLANRFQLHRTMRESEARFRLLAEYSTDALVHIGLDHRVRYISPAITAIDGKLPSDVVGKIGAFLVPPEDHDHMLNSHDRVVEAAGEVVTFECRTIAADGSIRWLEARARLIVGDEGGAEGIVSLLRDVTDRRATEHRLMSEAMTDPLTGLPNRRSLSAIVGKDAQATGTTNSSCVAIIDIDHFKQVNDRYGHDAGDIVLQGFAAVARRTVRESDMVARLGGEEFAIYFPATTLPQALAICDRLRSELGSTIFRAGHNAIAVTVSGGVAELGEDGIDAALKIADMALYRAKQAGRNQLALAA